MREQRANRLIFAVKLRKTGMDVCLGCAPAHLLVRLTRNYWGFFNCQKKRYFPHKPLSTGQGVVQVRDGLRQEENLFPHVPGKRAELALRDEPLHRAAGSRPPLRLSFAPDAEATRGQSSSHQQRRPRGCPGAAAAAPNRRGPKELCGRGTAAGRTLRLAAGTFPSRTAAERSAPRRRLSPRCPRAAPAPQALRRARGRAAPARQLPRGAGGSEAAQLRRGPGRALPSPRRCRRRGRRRSAGLSARG